MPKIRKKANHIIEVNNIGWFEKLGRWFNKYLYLSRIFFAINPSFVDGIFLIIYMIEQAVMVYLTKEFWTSILAVIVLTTFGFQKLFLESRMQIQENKFHELNAKHENLLSYANSLVEEYNGLKSESDKLYKRYQKVIEENNTPQNLNSNSHKISKKRHGD